MVTVILLRKVPSNLFKFYSEPKIEDLEAELIKIPAKLIKSDFKLIKCSKTENTSEEISSINEAARYLSESLNALLDTIFVGISKPLKVASIGKASIQASRPRVLLVPFQVGLGIQCHHLFGSQLLYL